MFAKTIVTSDAFLDMPMSARCLYFTLAMFADDDGFVNNPKSIMRQCGASDGDMQILLNAKFILLFESGVIVIKHWRIHNYIRGDRKHDTKYETEMDLLTVKENGAYTLKNSVSDTCQSNVSQLTGICHTEDRIGKDSLGKDSKRFTPPTLENVKAYCHERKNNVDAVKFVDYYTANGWKVGRNKMKDWKASVRTWERNGFASKRERTNIPDYMTDTTEQAENASEDEINELMEMMKRL